MQPSSVQSNLRFPLTQLLANGGHVRVLRSLMAHGAPLGVAQLAADSGLTTRGTRLVLDSLVSQGIVGVLGQPRSQVFTVVTQHPMAPTLEVLFERERARWEALQESLRERMASQKDIRSAWLYGSVARGQDGPQSDVDVAVLVNEDSLDVAHRVRDAIQEIGDSLCVHFSAVVLTPGDVAKLPKDDPWWSNVVRDAKVLKGLAPNKEAVRCSRAAQPA